MSYAEEADMRTLAITQNITVDGSIEMLRDWFDPQGQADVDNSDLLEELHRQDSRADGFLVGRQTFEDLRGYWPKQADDATGVQRRLHQNVLPAGEFSDPINFFPAVTLKPEVIQTRLHLILDNDQNKDRIFAGRGGRAEPNVMAAFGPAIAHDRKPTN